MYVKLVRKINFPSFRLLKRTLTPLQVIVAIDQESGCGFIKTVPTKKKKKCDSAVDEACGLLRAVKKIWKKIMSSPYLENLWRIKFEI